jgi:hypothetical protein
VGMGLKCDWKMLDTKRNAAPRHFQGRIGHEPNLPKPLQQYRERNPGLQARQGRGQTEVNAYSPSSVLASGISSLTK